MNRSNLQINSLSEKLKKQILTLGLIGISAFIIRIYFGNFELPVISDSYGYFLFASDISINSQLPNNYSISNTGWPIFLGGLFSIFEFNTVLEYMQLQKISTVILSTLTIIPVYFLCKKFFNNKLSLVGAIIFAFEPRIILNSSLGITEPLYILLGTTAVVCFISNNKKLIYSSFVIVAFVSMIRSEGVFLFLAISIMFIIRFRKEKLVIPKYFLILIIFIILLLPMATYRTETAGDNGLTDRILNGINGHILGNTEFLLVDENLEQHVEELKDNNQQSFLVNGSKNFIKYIGWDLIPIFILFVPIGLLFLFKKIDSDKGIIISLIILMSIPAFYAYSIPLEDTRYFFFLYPIFCVISLFTIERIKKIFKNENKILVLIILGIIISSIIFLYIESLKYEYEKDVFYISKNLLTSKMIINELSPETQYLESTNVLENLLLFESHFLKDREKGISVRETIPQNISIISSDDYNSLIEFIKQNKKQGLSHIIVDEKYTDKIFLQDIFDNEIKYPYLIKKMDSNENGFTYHVKIFKIDYKKFEEVEFSKNQ
jgi:hypothetical protein